MEEAKGYGKNIDRVLTRETRAARDPSSWLPPSGDLLDERIADTIAGFEAEAPLKGWHKSTLPSLKELAHNPTIRELHPSWVKKFIRRPRSTTTIRGQGYAFASIKQQLSLLNRAIKWRAETLNVSPPSFPVPDEFFYEAAAQEGLRKEEVFTERDRRLEPGEEAMIMARLAVEDSPQAKHWPLLVRFAIATGARLQEMIKAEWKEIHATGESWDIPGEHSKTKSRSMMLTDEALEALAELRQLRDPIDPKIFHTFGTPKAASTAFQEIRDEIGLVDFVFHDLRHEGISRFVLTQPDLPITAIMDMVGHSSLKMTKRYAKLRRHELAGLMRRRPPAPSVEQRQQAPSVSPLMSISHPSAAANRVQAGGFWSEIKLPVCVFAAGQPPTAGGFYGFSGGKQSASVVGQAAQQSSPLWAREASAGSHPPQAGEGWRQPA